MPGRAVSGTQRPTQLPATLMPIGAESVTPLGQLIVVCCRAGTGRDPTCGAPRGAAPMKSRHSGVPPSVNSPPHVSPRSQTLTARYVASLTMPVASLLIPLHGFGPLTQVPVAYACSPGRRGFVRAEFRMAARHWIRAGPCYCPMRSPGTLRSARSCRRFVPFVRIGPTSPRPLPGYVGVMRPFSPRGRMFLQAPVSFPRATASLGSGPV